MENTFGISKPVLRAMRESGYETLRPVQEKCIPLLLSGRQIMVQAETGAGKTAAYLIPSICAVDSESGDTQILVLAPTRELALQIQKTAEKLGTYARVHSIALIGGIDVRRQQNALHNRPHLLIGTPGRIADLLRQKVLDLSHLKMVIMDEADQLIATGQRTETEEILAACHCPRSLFSATLKDSVRSFIEGSYTEVILDRAAVSQRISLYFLACTDRTEALLSFFSHVKVTSALVFVNHRTMAAQLAAQLRSHHILAQAFSSDYEEKKRIRIINDFSSGKIRVLTATDAAARGLDLPEVSHIIHYDLPEDTETFVHRSGRSGHQGSAGCAVVLLDERGSLSETGRALKHSCEPFPLSEKEEGSNLSVPLAKETSGEPSVIRILIRAGRRDRIRPKDLIGALCTVLPFSRIGTVEIQDRFSTAVLLTDDDSIMDQLVHLSIKGKQRRIERIK